MLRIKNRYGEFASIIDIGKANYSRVFYIDKNIKGCSKVGDNGLKYFFWQKDFDSGLVKKISEGNNE